MKTAQKPQWHERPRYGINTPFRPSSKYWSYHPRTAVIQRCEVPMVYVSRQRGASWRRYDSQFVPQSNDVRSETCPPVGFGDRECKRKVRGRMNREGARWGRVWLVFRQRRGHKLIIKGPVPKQYVIRGDNTGVGITGGACKNNSATVRNHLIKISIICVHVGKYMQFNCNRFV